MYTARDYLTEIRKRFENNFDIEEGVSVGNSQFEMLAIYEEISGRTFVSQNDIIDRLEKYERIYFKYTPHATIEALEEIACSLSEWAGSFMPDSIDHMSTTVTAVVYSDKIDENCMDWLKRFKFTKFYAFAMKGWCDIRFVLIDLKTEKVNSCKLAQRVKPVFDVNVKNLRRKKLKIKLWKK